MKRKTVYALRIREDDSAEWGEPDYYCTRKERDREAMYCRILGGFRTHSYDERVLAEKAAELLDEEL